MRSLGLKSEAEWRDYCKSGKKPTDIPANPNQTYAEDGWVGMGDWLGTGRSPLAYVKYRSFKKARAFVHSLGLKSQTEWRAYCKSGKKPDDIPADPHDVYAKTGWAGMGDWLGTGTVARGLRQYRSFKKARAFVRSLGFEISRPNGATIASQARSPTTFRLTQISIYAKAGWVGMGDWLGTGRVAAPRGRELEARTVG